MTASASPAGGGRVTETESATRRANYEVEITLADGSQVDVQGDREFNVVGSESDDDSAEDGD